MKQIRQSFVWSYDYEFGYNGWRIKNAPASYNASTSGRLVAHDVLEHRKTDKGTLADECRALGAILVTRGDWLSNGYGYGFEWCESIHSDIVSLIGGDRLNFDNCPAPKNCRFPDESYAYYQFQQLRDSRKKLIDSCFSECNEEIDRATLGKTIDAAIRAMHQGYFMARKRYEGWPNIRDQWQELCEKVDEIEHCEEGDTLKIVLSPESVVVTHRSIYD